MNVAVSAISTGSVIDAMFSASIGGKTGLLWTRKGIVEERPIEMSFLSFVERLSRNPRNKNLCRLLHEYHFERSRQHF